MIYFIFLACLALVTCYLVFHWRNRTEFRLRKQLVNLSTRWLVHLPCYSVFYLPYLQATCSLVYSLTCPLTMLLCLWYKQLVHSFTRWLVYLPCYSVFYLPCLQATGWLVYSLTYLLTMLPIEVSKSQDKDKNWNVAPQNLFLTKRLSKFALGTWLCQI